MPGGFRKAQICIGHAYHKIRDSREMRTRLTNISALDPDTEFWEILHAMVAGKEPDGANHVYPTGFIYMTIGNLGICMYSTGTDKVVWFYNPTGIVADFEKASREYTAFATKYELKDWYPEIFKATKDEVFRGPRFPDERMTAPEEVIYHSMRIEHMYYNSPSSIKSQISNQLISWALTRKPTKDTPTIPHGHIATAVFTLAQLIGKQNVHVLHPYHSMNMHRLYNRPRPIQRIARNADPTLFLLGIYFKFAEWVFDDNQEMGGIRRKKDMLDIIDNLRTNVFSEASDDGHDNVLDGAIMYVFGKDLPFRQILEDIYEMIPTVEELGLQRKRVRTRMYSSYHLAVNKALRAWKNTKNLETLENFFKAISSGSAYATDLRVSEIMSRWQYEFHNEDRFVDDTTGSKYRRLHKSSYCVDMTMIILTCKHDEYFRRIAGDRNVVRGKGVSKLLPTRRNRWLL